MILAAESRQIVSVGRLIEKKGFADLISACRLLKPRGREFVCEIIGEGPLEPALQSQIARDGLESCVKLIGPQTQSQIALRLAHATIFALPCTREEGGGMDNLPTVIMEAMAAGLPVISTPLAGVPEMVEHGSMDYWFRNMNRERFAAAIEYLIANPVEARRFGDRGREIAREKFSIETSGRALRALFASCSRFALRSVFWETRQAIPIPAYASHSEAATRDFARNSSRGDRRDAGRPA